MCANMECLPSTHPLRDEPLRISSTWPSHGYGLLSITYSIPILPCSLCMICSSIWMTCFGDPCFALHMIHDSTTCMCVCMLGGDITCYCHVFFVPHAYDDTLILLCVRAYNMSCALPISIICSHDMIAMISSSVLHLRSTSLHDMITMIACLVASPMIHTCSFHAVDGIHSHALHMIDIASCHISPYVASLMLDDLPCLECNNASC